MGREGEGSSFSSSASSSASVMGMGMGMMEMAGEVEVGSEDVAEFLHRVYRYGCAALCTCIGVCGETGSVAGEWEPCVGVRIS